jgi:spermidine synthase
MRTGQERYDVILMNMGDPVNAQLNRFYTTSFFRAVKNRLTPSGIFSFDVSGSEDMLGEVQIQFLGAIYRTLEEIFSSLSVLPGDRIRFFATGGAMPLSDDPLQLSGRIEQRHLDLSYVRRDTLLDSFETFRLQYLKAVLQDTPAHLINRDFTPLCYTHALNVWARQWHPLLGQSVRWMTQIRPHSVWLCFLSACVVLLIVFRAGRAGARRTIPLNVALVGGLCMVTQMGMLIVFQILKGSLFLHLAIIVALFMAGLAGGAAWITSMSRNPRNNYRQMPKQLVRIQALVCALPCVLAGIFLLLHGPLEIIGGSILPVFLFPVLSFISGMLAGSHFAIATATMVSMGHSSSAVGGQLYAWDLAGSAGGLLGATFLLLPALGPVQMLPMLSIAGFSCLWLLIGSLR